MTKDTSKLFRVAALVAIGFIAIGAGMNEAAARGKSEAKSAEDVGRTASSYRKPIHLSPSASKRRGNSGRKETGGKGGLQTQSVQ